MLPPTRRLAFLPQRLALIPLCTLTDLKVRGVISLTAAMCPSAEGHPPPHPSQAPNLFPVPTCFTLGTGPCQPVYPTIPASHCLGTMFFFLSERHLSLLVVFSCVIVGLSSEFHAAYSCQKSPLLQSLVVLRMWFSERGPISNFSITWTFVRNVNL